MTDTPNLDGPPSPYVEEDASWRDGLCGEVFNVEVEDMPRWQCLLTIVEDPQERYDLSTFRVKRSGGATPGDHQYRHNVFVLVGAITVAAGHIEAEMKRIIVVAEESESAGFADVPSTWSGLVDRLTAIADGDGMLAEPLRAVLDWGAEQKVAEIRHAAVHSAWWVFDAGPSIGRASKTRATGLRRWARGSRWPSSPRRSSSTSTVCRRSCRGRWRRCHPSTPMSRWCRTCAWSSTTALDAENLDGE